MKSDEIFSHWEQVRTDLLWTIEQFSDDELSYQPFIGSWPLGKIMLHIAETEDFWLHGIIRKMIDVDTIYELDDYPTREAIRGVLDRSRNMTLAWLDSLEETDLGKECTTPHGETFTIGWIIWHVLEHEIHHRGELSLALGLLGRDGLDV